MSISTFGKKLRIVSLLLLFSVLSACGGGDSAPAPTPPPGSGENYGSLTVSGTDTGVFGANFTAASGGSQYASDGKTLINLIWANTNSSGIVGSTHAMGVTVVTAAGGEPTIVSFIASANDQSQWMYALTCPGVCGNVVVDLAAKQVTFSNVVLNPVVVDINKATGTVTLTGTIQIANL